MTTISLTIEIPDGADVQIHRTEDSPATPDIAEVRRYYRNYLSENGRALFAAAAVVQLDIGDGFTFDDVAKELGRSYSSTLSLHRNTGKSAKRWDQENGTEAPIGLIDLGYHWVEDVEGMRTSYRLDLSVARTIKKMN